MKPATGMVTATGPRKLRALVAGGALRSLNARIPRPLWRRVKVACVRDQVLLGDWIADACRARVKRPWKAR